MSGGKLDIPGIGGLIPDQHQDVPSIPLDISHDKVSKVRIPGLDNDATEARNTPPEEPVDGNDVGGGK